MGVGGVAPAACRNRPKLTVGSPESFESVRKRDEPAQALESWTTRATSGLVPRNLKNAKRYRFVVPVATWAANAIQPSLSILCPRSEMQLHPHTHTDIVRLLADGETLGFPKEFVTFDENDVFYRVTDDGNEYFSGIAKPKHEFSVPFLAKAYLDLIRVALDEGALDASKEDALVSALLLPDVNGQATDFAQLYSSASLPHNIPRLRLPPMLDRSLVSHALFKRRKWRLQKFTMADFLEGGTLHAADNQTRRMFWEWLHRNSRRIKQRERTKLAELVIWPDERGELCNISDLCEPSSKRVGAVLAQFIRRPHERVRRCSLVSVGGKARTSVRRRPSEAEVTDWINTQLARFEIEKQPSAIETKALRQFETDLSILLKDRSTTPLLKESGATLPALAQDGSIRQRSELVIPSPANKGLALPNRFLLKNWQRAKTIDKLSAALGGPTPAMLLDAFAEDPENVSALHTRLDHFMRVTEPGSDERRSLADMPVIPVGEQFRAPSELAFTGNKGNFWGNWKTHIPTKGLSQNDQSRYRDAGVTSASPNLETSRRFFSWLASQKQEVLRQHIPCVVRHFLHQSGPKSWASSFTDVPCIPTENRDGFRLVSLKMARRKPVFLSDAGEHIGDAVIQGDGAVRLVIHQAKEVRKPISEQLRELGIKSLRESLRDPERVVGGGDRGPVGKEILAQFNKLRSSRFRSTIEKRLVELGVGSELLRRNWHERLGRVETMRFTTQVEARYRFRNKPYSLYVDAGLDPGTGVFWIKQDLGSHQVYESVAKQLVFKSTAQPIYLLALQRAVEMNIADPSFGNLVGSDEDASEGTTNEENLDGEATGALGEAELGHSPFEPDPNRNRPKPETISTKPTESPRRPKEHPRSTNSGGSSSPRHVPDTEKKHIETLKRDHYASHCQMCLCERLPQELAPAGSYIEWEEVRRKVVEAHHPDLVSAGGARHAGNLILLCKFHHDNYGRQFTRAGVTAALQSSPKETSICFGEDSSVSGQQIEIAISGTGEVVKLFFTDHHVEYWLSEETTTD